MALDVTVGGVNSNSYASVEEADQYFAGRLHADAWDSLKDKSKGLITATSLIDWYITFKGVKTDSAQALQWPRVGVQTRTGEAVDQDIIPREIKIAVYEMALVSIEADRTEDSDMAGLEMIKAGSLQIKNQNAGTYSTAKKVIPEHVWKAVSDYSTRSGVGVVRLMRA